MSKKIKMLMLEREITQIQLAEKLGTSQSNLANKLKRDNFSEKELIQIAGILNATYEGNFILNDTGKSI
jgi:transcriptional regulator with XRE-family HTH domain